jgi:hypothetical protein
VRADSVKRASLPVGGPEGLGAAPGDREDAVDGRLEAKLPVALTRPPPDLGDAVDVDGQRAVDEDEDAKGDSLHQLPEGAHIAQRASARADHCLVAFGLEKEDLRRVERHAASVVEVGEHPASGQRIELRHGRHGGMSARGMTCRQE